MSGSRQEAAGAAVQLFQTAVRFHEEGDLARAEHLYRELLRQQPRHAGALDMLGVIACQTGNPRPGSQLIREALALEPDNPDFNNNLGMAQLQLGDTGAAITAFEKALALRPRFAEAHFNLGNALLARQLPEDAEKHFRAALRARPDYVDALNNLGNLLRRRGQAREAAQLFHRLVRLAPDFAGGFYNLALALEAQGQWDAAVDAFTRSLELDPHPARVWEALGHCHRRRGALSAAEEAFQAAVERQPSATAWDALGQTQFAQGRVDDARSSFQRALALAPRHAAILNHIGMAFSALGDKAQAAAHFEQAVAADADCGEAYRNLAALRPDRVRARQLIDAVSARLDADPPLRQRIDLQFALGRLCDDVGDWERAFAAFRAANDGRRADIPFDAAAQNRFIDALIATFSPAFFARVAGMGDATELPVFIVGMPRSGTTLVEQIIASHPRVHGAGELTFFPEHAPALSQRGARGRPFPAGIGTDLAALAALGPPYLALLRAHGGAAERVTDKMPYNFLYLGVIAALFPRARVVHCRRDAVATCFSIYTHDLAGSHPYSYDLTSLGSAYCGYARLLAHWRKVLPLPLIEVSYDRLVAAPEAQIGALIAALGLPWDAACLRFHENARAVTTASHWQVREPMHTAARTHWRHYADHLGPLLAALDHPAVAALEDEAGAT